MFFGDNIADWMKEESWDREYTNESDGMHFFGSDGDDGYTLWYSDDGTLDCRLPTPMDDE
ncbi:MAG: hypothetical protein J1E34_00920 [Oscillospiraceae bacterium]|nr:hypothetical protein [Oscillospiraceae bacterium]